MSGTSCGERLKELDVQLKKEGVRLTSQALRLHLERRVAVKKGTGRQGQEEFKGEDGPAFQTFTPNREMNEVDGYEVVYRTDVAARLQRGYFGKPEGATARVYELVLSNPTAFESKQANKIRVRVDAWGNQDPFAASSRVFAEVVASQLVRSVYKKMGQIQEDLVEFHRHPLSLGDGDGPLPVGLIVQVMGKDGVSPQAASEVQQMLSDDAYCYPYLRALSIMGALFLVQLNSPALHGAIRQREELEEALLQEQQALAMASKSAGEYLA